MKKMFSNKKIYLLIFILFITLSFMNKGYSKEEDLQLVECSKSSAYLEWEKLSDEEKENSIMPPVCDKEADNLSYKTFSFSVRGTLPSSYDGRLSKVKNQVSTGECWAFSTTTIVETYAQKKDDLTYTFSPRHIDYSSTREFLNGAINDHGYNRSLGTGGHFYMSSNYLINSYGPISEEEMPFENNEDKIDISKIQNKNVLLDVNDIVLSFNTAGKQCSASQIQEIKEYVYNNGAVATTTYMTISSNYYNSKTAAFYYNGSYDINHAITIVGWDDNYSKDNFSSVNRPSSDGAWLVQNSYGTSFGKNGYYYISYEDIHICDFYMVIDGVDYEIEDNSYILDKLGYNSFIGYVSYDETTQYTTAYAMNVFTKEAKNESLKEITFGTNGTGNYTIYYMEGKATTNTSISNMTKIGSGTINYAGYITHKLDSPITIDKDVTNFSIAIYYDMDSSTKPVPVSTSSVSKYEYITTEENVSFISFNGKSWSDLYERSYPTIASIKAFTDDLDYSLTVNDYNVTYDDNLLLEINTTASNIDLNDLKIIIKDENDQTITPISTNYTNGSNLSKISLSLTKPIENNTYSVTIYYKDETIATLSIPITIVDPSANYITSTEYQIDQDNFIIYVNPTTTISTFLSNIEGNKDNVYKQSTIITSGYVATGMTINDYLIVVKGDVTGDGYIRMNDVMRICDYIVEGIGLDEISIKAADVTSDSNIRMNDVMKISEYIIEGGNL